MSVYYELALMAHPKSKSALNLFNMLVDRCLLAYLKEPRAPRVVEVRVEELRAARKAALRAAYLARVSRPLRVARTRKNSRAIKAGKRPAIKKIGFFSLELILKIRERVEALSVRVKATRSNLKKEVIHLLRLAEGKEVSAIRRQTSVVKNLSLLCEQLETELLFTKEMLYSIS